MNNKSVLEISKYISYLFIPPVMNLFIFIIYSLEYELYPASILSITISLAFGLIIPLLTILEFRRRGLISNNDATIKEERAIPYLYAIGFSLAGLLISAMFGLHDRIIMLWMVYLINSILIIQVNKYWKISAHAMGVTMPLGALILFPNITLFLIAIGIFLLVSFSRLYLGVHTFLQVLAGSLVGFIVSFVLINYCR